MSGLGPSPVKEIFMGECVLTESLPLEQISVDEGVL